MKIQLIARPSDAPCCVKVLALPDADEHPDQPDILVQTDWEWPAVAQAFGWSTEHKRGKKNSTLDYDTSAYMDNPDYPPACDGSSCTDGTINCPVCGKTASSFIQEARQYLDDNDGCIADDPGYFKTI